MLENRTAAQLADAFADMRDFTHNTGGLSMLHEAAQRFANRHQRSDLDTALNAFAAARYAHKREYGRNDSSPAALDLWRECLRTGDLVANHLRALGDERAEV